MTLKEFKKRVLRASWYEEYFYYLLYSSLILAILYLFVTKAGTPTLSYEKLVASYILTLFLIIAASFALWRIPNRYKVLSVPSNFSLERKNEIVYKLLNKLNREDLNRENYFYKFTYHESQKSYSVFVGISDDTFYLSIQGNTSKGILDTGGTEEVRNTILFILEDIVAGKEHYY